MFWSDDKKLSSGANVIGWNSLKKLKKKVYLLIVTLSPTSLPPFYLFIFPQLFTLISLFLYPFIFFYFDTSYSHHFTINLSFSLSHFMHSFPTHKNAISLSLSLNFFLFVLFVFFWLVFLHLYFMLIEFLCSLELYFGLMWFSFMFLSCYIFSFLWLLEVLIAL